MIDNTKILCYNKKRKLNIVYLANGRNVTFKIFYKIFSR